MVEVPRRAWSWLGTSAAARVTQVIAIGSLLLSFFVLGKQVSLTSCVAAYNDRASAATAARVIASEQDRRAEDDMWQAFADAADPSKVPPAQARQHATDAFNQFIATRADARRQRAENPFPAPPSKAC